MIEETITLQTVHMLPEDMSNFLALIACNSVEAEFASKKAKSYKILITEIKKD